LKSPLRLLPMKSGYAEDIIKTKIKSYVKPSPFPSLSLSLSDFAIFVFLLTVLRL
jgi:hypothetical protein